jgi:hypothetical protein
MKKKILTYYYIMKEIRLARIMLNEIHKHNTHKNKKIDKKTYNHVKLQYYLQELHPLIVVYKTKYPEKYIKFPKF